MNRLNLKWFISLALLLSAVASSQAARQASTPEERDHAVRVTRALETQPTSSHAPEWRTWLIRWYAGISDMKVPVCRLLGKKPNGPHPFYSEVAIQSMFGTGAFMIEHPDQAKDLVATQTAGVESALLVYEFYVKAQPDARIPFLDGLVKKRNAGTLQAYVTEGVQQNCK